MIVQKMQLIREKLEKRETLRRTQSELDLLEQIQERLKDLRRDLKRTTAETLSIRPFLDDQVHGNIISQAQQMQVTLETLRLDFEEGKSRPQQIRQLKTMPSVVAWERQLTEEWEKYFDQQAEESSMLARIIHPYISQESQENLLGIWNDLQMCKSLPRSAEDIETFDKAIAAYKAEIEQLAANFPVEVRGFLQKLNEGDATVLDISPDILTWCKEKEIADRLHIRLTSR